MTHDHGPDCKCCTEGPTAFWADLEDKIAKSGHAVLSTMTTLPIGDVSMAYTIGLTDTGLPELLVFGLPRKSPSSYSMMPRSACEPVACRPIRR